MSRPVRVDSVVAPDPETSCRKMPKPYRFIRFGDVHGPKPYKFIGFFRLGYVRETHAKADEAQTRFDSCRHASGQTLRESKLWENILEKEGL